MKESPSPKTLRFYPYRATFDFECFFDGEALPANSDRVQWIARHVPLSVSVASNVPGHEPPRCYVTDGDSDKWWALWCAVSVPLATQHLICWYHRNDNVLNELEVRKDTWDEAERKAPKEDDSKPEADEEVEMEESKTNPYKTLIDNCSVGYISYQSSASTRGGMIWMSLNNSSYLTCWNPPNKTTKMLTKKKKKKMMMMMIPDSSLNDRTHSCVSRRRS